MVEVDANYDRRAGVTLVRATVRNTRTTAQLVRLRSALDGPTWPPRHRGVTTPEWTSDTWEGIVEPNQCRGVGFASPAAPVEQDPNAESDSHTDSLVDVVTVERAPVEPQDTTREVLAELEEWSPPLEVFSRPR